MPKNCTDLILDAEKEWEGSDPKIVKQLTDGLRAANPNVAFHLSTFYAAEKHGTFPYAQFLAACESFMPQSYVVDETPVHVVFTRTIQVDPPLAKKSAGGLLIPTVNIPDILDPLIDTPIDGANVWVWDTNGGDEGVQGNEKSWSAVIAKFKSKF
jgi:hypothetical protein